MTLEELDQKIEALRKRYQEAGTASDQRLIGARGRALKYAKELKQQREGFL